MMRWIFRDTFRKISWAALEISMLAPNCGGAA
jgi:hypothetical protein